MLGKAGEAGQHTTEAGAWCFVINGCSGWCSLQCLQCLTQVREVWLVRRLAHLPCCRIGNCVSFEVAQVAIVGMLSFQMAKLV